jgi:hypothetical protein
VVRAYLALAAIFALALAYGAGNAQGHRAERKSWELAVARQAREAAEVLAESEASLRAREQELGALKDRIEVEHINAEAKIAGVYRDNARLLAALGGLRERQGTRRRGADQVFADPACTADASGSATSERGLSEETSRALLDLAALADRTAAYAAACHAWATSLSQPATK